MLLLIVIFIYTSSVIPFSEIKDGHYMPLLLIFVCICILANLHFWLLGKVMENEKSLKFIIMFYVMFLLYFVCLLITLFVILYIYVFKNSFVDLSISGAQQLQQMNSDVVSLVNSNDIPNLLSNIEFQLTLYASYMMDTSVYNSLQNLSQQNQIVMSYYNSLNGSFVQNMQQIYNGLSSVIQATSALIDAYNVNDTVLDRLNYLVFDYADYYKNNIIPNVIDTNVFSNILVSNDNQLSFGDLSIFYDNNISVLDDSNSVVFSFNNNNNSSFFVSLSNGTMISNLQYTAAVSFNGDHLYIYLTQSPCLSTDGFQSNISNTIGYSGLFLDATASDISSMYFNSSISNNMNLPVNMFYNNLYNSIIYENIGIPMKFEYVNYNDYTPILVAYNGTQPQWIIQSESGIPLCVVNKVNGQFVVYFAVSDSASVMVNSSSQSVVAMGIDSVIWNVI